jgi:hypothetical protein
MTLDHVKRTKDRYEGQLLSLNSVQGVGIGREGDQPAIAVYADRSVPDHVEIPSTLDDVPVVVEESGTFEAQ